MQGGEGAGPDGGAGTSGLAGSSGAGTTGAAGTRGSAGEIGAAGASFAGSFGSGEAGTMASPPQDAAAHLDAEAPDAESMDAVTTLVCPPFVDGGTSPSACRLATVPSQNCTVAPVAIVPATLCAGAATCPVTMAARLACDVGCYPEISLAPRADGASILLDVANSSNPTARSTCSSSRSVPRAASTTSRFS
jgi:hypothetical protein